MHSVIECQTKCKMCNHESMSFFEKTPFAGSFRELNL